MRVYILHQYFRTPVEGGAIRSYYLARALAEAGYEVEVITAWNQPHPQRIRNDGFQVHYLPVFYSNSLSFTRRVMAFSSFSLRAFVMLLRKKKPDVLYAISTPLTTGLLALAYRKITKIPYIFEIGDLWPDVPVQMGIIKNPVAIRLLKRLELSIYSAAHSLVAMSPFIAQYLADLGYGSKTVMITNFADISFSHLKVDLPPKEGADFVITYTGALGRANHLAFFLDLAEAALRLGATPLKFQIMGEGAEKQQLIDLASKRKLTNVVFLEFGSKAEAIKTLLKSDAAYLSFDRYCLLWSGSPNKYFDALATGTPILCNFGGWVAEEIRSNECGYSYDPSRPEEAVEVLNSWAADRTKVTQMKKNAFALAQAKYSLEIQMPKWLALFRS